MLQTNPTYHTCSGIQTIVHQPDTSATITDSVAMANTATAYEILINWEEYKGAIRSSEPEDRIFEQVHAATIADERGLTGVDFAKMDDSRYTDPATGLPIPPANAAKVLSDPHKKLWDEAMRIEEETLDKMEVFEHDLTMYGLRTRGVVPSARLSRMAILNPGTSAQS